MVVRNTQVQAKRWELNPRAFWVLAEVLVYMGLIFFMSSQPAGTSVIPKSWPAHMDKLCHAAEYGILYLLWVRVCVWWQVSEKKSMMLWWPLAIIALYAMTDEWHQSFVHGRDSSVWDFCADVVGAGLAMFLLRTKDFWLFRVLSKS